MTNTNGPPATINTSFASIFFDSVAQNGLEDWTITPSDPVDDGKSSSPPNFFLYSIITSFLIAFVVSFVYICIKIKSESSCNPAEMDSHSSDAFNAEQRSPKRIDFPVQLHRPPSRSNQFSDSRRELLDEPTRTDLIRELDSNQTAADTTGVTISVIDATFSNDRRAPDHAVAEKPPDYSTVMLSDFLNPAKPAFPVVKKENETPPPEYGKENTFFK